jgi:hypothetical protein
VASKKTSGKANQDKKSTVRAKRTIDERGAESPAVSETIVSIDARSHKDRRQPSERRKKEAPVAVERRQLERRVKVNRRRQIDPTTCERDYTPEEIEFMSALDDYKRRSGRMFPTCSEVLEVIKNLGYEKPLVAAISPSLVVELPAMASMESAV